METCSLVVYQIYHPLWGKVGIAVCLQSVFVQCTQYNSMYMIYRVYEYTSHCIMKICTANRLPMMYHMQSQCINRSRVSSSTPLLPTVVVVCHSCILRFSVV